MFPFNLSGPWFLLFYAGLTLLALFLQWHYSNAPPKPGRNSLLNELTADPYRIAYLREADREIVRLAIVNLVDRGLVCWWRNLLVAKDAERSDFVRRPLERAILACCAAPARTEAVFDDPDMRAACSMTIFTMCRKMYSRCSKRLRRRWRSRLR